MSAFDFDDVDDGVAERRKGTTRGSVDPLKVLSIQKVADEFADDVEGTLPPASADADAPPLASHQVVLAKTLEGMDEECQVAFVQRLADRSALRPFMLYFFGRKVDNFCRALDFSLVPAASLTRASLSRVAELVCLRKLVLSGKVDATVSSADWARLGRLVQLEVLDVTRCASFNDDASVCLRPMKELVVLRVGYTALTDAAMGNICSLGRLRSIDLSGNKVTGRAITMLTNQIKVRAGTAGLLNLEKLHLRDTAIDAGDSVLDVCEFPVLSSVSFIKTKVTIQQLLQLSKEIRARQPGVTRVKVIGERTVLIERKAARSKSLKLDYEEPRGAPAWTGVLPSVLRVILGQRGLPSDSTTANAGGRAPSSGRGDALNAEIARVRSFGERRILPARRHQLPEPQNDRIDVTEKAAAAAPVNSGSDPEPEQPNRGKRKLRRIAQSDSESDSGSSDDDDSGSNDGGSNSKSRQRPSKRKAAATANESDDDSGSGSGSGSDSSSSSDDDQEDPNEALGHVADARVAPAAKAILQLCEGAATSGARSASRLGDELRKLATTRANRKRKQMPQPPQPPANTTRKRQLTVFRQQMQGWIDDLRSGTFKVSGRLIADVEALHRRGALVHLLNDKGEESDGDEEAAPNPVTSDVLVKVLSEYSRAGVMDRWELSRAVATELSAEAGQVGGNESKAWRTLVKEGLLAAAEAGVVTQVSKAKETWKVVATGT